MYEYVSRLASRDSSQHLTALTVLSRRQQATAGDSRRQLTAAHALTACEVRQLATRASSRPPRLLVLRRTPSPSAAPLSTLSSSSSVCRFLSPTNPSCKLHTRPDRLTADRECAERRANKRKLSWAVGSPAECCSRLQLGCRLQQPAASCSFLQLDDVMVKR